MPLTYINVEGTQFYKFRNLFCNKDFSYGRQIEFFFLIFNKVKRDLLKYGVIVDENSLEIDQRKYNQNLFDPLLLTGWYEIEFKTINNEDIRLRIIFKNNLISKLDSMTNSIKISNILHQSFDYIIYRMDDLIEVLNVLKTARKYRQQVAIEEVGYNGPYPGDEPGTSRLSNVLLFSILNQNEEYIRKYVQSGKGIALPQGTEYTGEVLFQRLEEILLDPTVGFI